jgi:hypothetical protein
MQVHSVHPRVTRKPQLDGASTDTRELALTLMDPAHRRC